MTVSISNAAPSHPLGPLAADEIKQASSLIKKTWPAEQALLFKAITLLEPAKAELLPYLQAARQGQPLSSIDRRAFVLYYFRATVSFSRRCIAELMLKRTSTISTRLLST